MTALRTSQIQEATVNDSNRTWTQKEKSRAWKFGLKGEHPDTEKKSVSGEPI